MEIILEAINTRNLLIQVIDQIIEVTYVATPGKYVRRGIVQKFILNQLGLNKNNMLCGLINNRMEAKGYTAVTCHGNQSFRGVSHLPTQYA